MIKRFFFSAENVSFLVIFFLIGISQYAFIYPEQTRMKNVIKREYRQSTLQKMQVKMMNASFEGNLRVLKVKRGREIHIEILAEREDGSFTKIQSFKVKGSRDAFYTYWDKSNSLIALDLDGQGEIGIFAPSFDKFFRPQGNFIKYNSSLKTFEFEILEEWPEITDRS